MRAHSSAFKNLLTLVKGARTSYESSTSTEPLSLEMPPAFAAFKDLQQLIVIRCLRTDKIVLLSPRTREKLGSYYVEPPLVNLESI